MEEADASQAGADAHGPFGVPPDYSAALAAQLAEAADLAHAHWAAGRRVVVCCKFGYNRSASTVLALLARHRGEPLAAGLAQLRAARPKVYPNIETWPSLLAIEAAAGLSRSVSEAELLAHHSWAPGRRQREKSLALLRALSDECMAPDVAARPSFAALSARLIAARL